MCVSQGERRCFGAKKRPSFIFALSLLDQKQQLKRTVNSMSAIPQSFFNATIISAKREMEDLRGKKKVSEREREVHASSARRDRDAREREREKRERDANELEQKRERDRVHFHRNVLSQRRACV